MKKAIACLVLLFCVSPAAAEQPRPISGSSARSDKGSAREQTYPGNLVRHEIAASFTEVYDASCGRYRYAYTLSNPFTPLPGYSYWLSVQAVMPTPPQWMWVESVPEADWGSQGVFRSDYYSCPEWVTFTELSGSYSELSFVIHTEEGPIVTRPPWCNGGWWSSQRADAQYFETECADDFLCGTDDPITMIEWWGKYSTPDPGDPSSFRVRIYQGHNTPVETTSWSAVKSLY